MDIINLNSFLKFGYFLNYENPDIKFDFSGINKEKYKNYSEQELVNKGITLWVNTIQKQFHYNEKHVIPLSGGIDSRAILGTLLKFTEAKNIYTYTFGTPKTLDFEIGNRVAKEVGTYHYNFPLTEYRYKLSELIDISKRVDGQTILFHHPPVSLVDELFSEYNVWSGIIIDVFFGRHTHRKKANNLVGAIINSFSENLYVKSTDLTLNDSNQYSKFIDYDYNTEGILPYEHVIDLLNRQLKFIYPHVLIKGYRYRTLLDKEIIDFALSIDNKFLEEQYLYKKMFFTAFPKLFSLPTKSNFGLPLNTSRIHLFLKRSILYCKRKSKLFINPYLNYIDFNEGIREREDLKNIIYNNIMDLKRRKIFDWLNIDKIWKDHINKKTNHADALLVLASLEIHLKAGKRI